MPDVKNDAAPEWASNSQNVFLMGRAMHPLTGRAARHENTEKYFLGGGQCFPKKCSLWEFVLPIKRMFFFFFIFSELSAEFALKKNIDLILVKFHPFVFNLC